MAKFIKPTDAPTTNLICEHCFNLNFKNIQDFTKHLRKQHCSIEGGSFVCRYGYNAVCCSLPVEGVSDKDYIAHISKHAAMQQQQKKSNGQLSEASTWTIYSASQNLPAVLNDPTKGKQGNFLTKTWGDSFVEKTDIPKSPLLPEVTMQHFDAYLKKVSRRYRKHSRINSGTVKIPVDSSQTFPNLKNAKSFSNGPLDNSQFNLGSIPKIFLSPNLDLSRRVDFDAVFPFAKDGLSNRDGNITITARQMQEKLSHYLDIVEVRIAEQVASKSQAFFHAMASHDVIMDQLVQTITICKALRKNIHAIDKNIVTDSFHILKLERAKSNNLLVSEKLKLMATVHQSQPMIQLLLSTPDYVAALDLISTTQEIVVQELNGIHSFRHLSSQLSEMERLIDKMLATEFEKYATADLNRPLNGDSTLLDGDKLISIVSGLLRRKHFQFIDTYKEEAVTTIRAITKQRVIEALAASDCCNDQQAAALEVGGLSLAERLTLLHSSIQSLTSLLYRVKAVHNILHDTIELSSGRLPDGTIDHSLTDCLLSDIDYTQISTKLDNMLISICDYCHERLGNLLSASPSEKDKEPVEVDPASNKADKEGPNMNEKSWLSERATTAQVCRLANMVEEFTETCEKLCGKQCTALRSAFKAQASKFVYRFHTERKTKLMHILDSEIWKQADVPPEIQALVTFVFANRHFPSEPCQSDENRRNADLDNFILVGDEKYAVVGATLILVQIIHEYCRASNELTALSGTIGRQLAELLRQYNSSSCRLVLGAGAMQAAGLKTITSTILVLSSRSLKLILWLMPFVKAHFQGFVNQSSNHGMIGVSSGGVALLDSVEKDIRSHIREIEGKITTIVENLFTVQISNWTAKPPVPSQSFKNISRHLIKLHEAVCNILPPLELQTLYRTVNSTFKEKLRDQLVKVQIKNDGGPQHGVVTLELMFYVQALRDLKIFSEEELDDSLMNDVWSR